MTRGHLAVATLALLLTSCDFARHVVTLTFDDSANTVTVATRTELGTPDARNPDPSLMDLRDALLAGRDEWSLRIANANPERERVTFEREQGSLRGVDHSAKIAVANLQKFFFDTALTVTTTRGEGWSELNIYPGSSLRATRQQRISAEKKLADFSELAARYFGRVATLYRYFDEKPQRAEPVLTWVFADKEKEKPAISEEEQSLVDAVRESIEKLATADPDGTLNSDLDAVYNPFPAEFHVIVPGEPLIVEGFTRSKDGALVVKTVDAVEAVGMLEGRWISPDPIAALVANDDKKSGAEIAAIVAPLPRRIGVVVGSAEISDALIEKMRPAPRYRVRWIIKPGAKPVSDKPETRN